MNRIRILPAVAFIFALTLASSGCTVIFQKGRRSDIEKISSLKSELNEMERAKKELEGRLSQEIADKQVKVEMLEKGLVITFVAEVLFDSGKADLKVTSFEQLAKVAGVVQTVVPDLGIGIEGHTDNEPIKRSGWKSNWELSSARALSVLHFLVEKDVSPGRLAAIGYGEYRPVTDNGSVAGRQKNRRVEIIIMPRSSKTEKMEQ